MTEGCRVGLGVPETLNANAKVPRLCNQSHQSEISGIVFDDGVVHVLEGQSFFSFTTLSSKVDANQPIEERCNRKQLKSGRKSESTSDKQQRTFIAMLVEFIRNEVIVGQHGASAETQSTMVEMIMKRTIPYLADRNCLETRRRCTSRGGELG
ncbi:hypothetical protein BV898_19566, partial [Hypsibius exemplaris]